MLDIKSGNKAAKNCFRVYELVGRLSLIGICILRSVKSSIHPSLVKPCLAKMKLIEKQMALEYADIRSRKQGLFNAGVYDHTVVRLGTLAGCFAG